MKKYFTFIISALILSVSMVGCSDKKLSDEEKAKIEEQKKLEQDEAVKATLVGYWQRTGFEVIGYKNGQKVGLVTNVDLLAELVEEIPFYFQFTQTSFILAPGTVDPKTQDYTLDSQGKTIVITDRDGEDVYTTHLNYTLSADNNTLTIVLSEDNEHEGTLSLYDKLYMNIKLERRASLPAG